MAGMRRLLIVTAVAAEHDAVCIGLGIPPDQQGASRPKPRLLPQSTVYPDPLSEAASWVDVAVVGVGPAAAAAGTARLLATEAASGSPYHAVVSAGVAGGFGDRAGVGDVVLADASIAADLGAESPDGFLPIDTLGFGTGTLPADPTMLNVPGARVGAILTVTTATGTLGTAAALATRHPGAVAEAMEGFGVATAASQAGVPFAEIRAISNLVGVRDRASWRLAEALAALTGAFTAKSAATPVPPPPEPPG